jgi:hypothetical protein
MGKKRKSEATRLDEVDRTMYGAFRGAANSLSQLYTHAMNHQRVSFLAGERRGMVSALSLLTLFYIQFRFLASGFDR